MSLRWWETKRRRDEKGHFIKKKRPVWRERWRKVKVFYAKVKETVIKK